MNTRRNMLKTAMFALLVTACLLGGGCGVSSAQAGSDVLTATLLKVGKADAIIIETAGEAMVIDTGEEEDK